MDLLRIAICVNVIKETPATVCPKEFALILQQALIQNSEDRKRDAAAEGTPVKPRDSQNSVQLLEISSGINAADAVEISYLKYIASYSNQRNAFQTVLLDLKEFLLCYFTLQNPFPVNKITSAIDAVKQANGNKDLNNIFFRAACSIVHLLSTYSPHVKCENKEYKLICSLIEVLVTQEDSLRIQFGEILIDYFVAWSDNVDNYEEIGYMLSGVVKQVISLMVDSIDKMPETTSWSQKISIAQEVLDSHGNTANVLFQNKATLLSWKYILLDVVGHRSSESFFMNCLYNIANAIPDFGM